MASSDRVSVDLREYTVRCLESAAGATSKDYDNLIRDGLHALGIGFPTPATPARTTCDTAHVNKLGNAVRCRRVLKPHPGTPHVWWARLIPNSREEWW